MMTFCTLLFEIDPSSQRGKHRVSYLDDGEWKTENANDVSCTAHLQIRFVYLRVTREGAAGRPLKLQLSCLPGGGQ